MIYNYHDILYNQYKVYIMKFVCLLHESKLQITELTEYKGTDTSIRHVIYINYPDTYLHVVLNTKCAKV